MKIFDNEASHLFVIYYCFLLLLNFSIFLPFHEYLLDIRFEIRITNGFTMICGNFIQRFGN